MTITRQDVQETTGSVQLCAGQILGIEAAVHAATTLFQQDDTDCLHLQPPACGCKQCVQRTQSPCGPAQNPSSLSSIRHSSD